MKIKAKTALITGSSGKLGYQIAFALAEKGCDCICHYHKNQTDAYGLVDKIETLGRQAYPIQADLSDPKQIPRLFGQGPAPSIVINSAAVFKQNPIENLTAAEARKTFEINAIAPLMISKAFAEVMKKAEIKNAKIINITDVAGHANWSQFSDYCASKAALISVTKSLAKELAPAITVNAVSPGYVNFTKAPDKEQAQRQIKHIPLKRLAKPGEIISAIMFIIENDYINGQVINIDGGRYI